jgi:hypothetical protein
MAVVLMAVTELEERQKPNGFREEAFEVETHLSLGVRTRVHLYD